MKPKKIKKEEEIDLNRKISFTIWRQAPMSYEGYMRWHPRVRRYINPIVHLRYPTFKVKIKDINSKEKLANYIYSIGGIGIFTAFRHVFKKMSSGKRGTNHKAIGKIVIKEIDFGKFYYHYDYLRVKNLKWWDL